MNSLSGSCLCGKITFEVDDDFRQLNLCHCTQCQKATGSAHASNLFTDPDNIRWKTGANLVSRFDVPGRSISNAFCTQCGSGMPYLSKTGSALVVPAGTLDDETGSSPTMRNIFWAERAAWYEDGIAAVRQDDFPE